MSSTYTSLWRSDVWSSVMFRLALVVLALGMPLARSAIGGPTQDPIRISGKPPLSGSLRIGAHELPYADIADSAMLRQLALIAGVFDARTLGLIRRSVEPAVALGSDSEFIGSLRISRGRDFKDLELLQLVDGSMALVDPVIPDQCYPIGAGVLDRLGINQAMLAGIQIEDPRTNPLSDPLGAPYFESSTTLDTKVRRARLKHPYPDLTRELTNERFRVRMPYSPDSDGLPGILVWISPTANGQIPRIFSDACDRLNLIAVGVDGNGNTRSLTDRLQLHLDSIATIESHYRIDLRRVYVTGMSGGGRCSSILQLGFPDIFMGAVPIVGLDSYHRTPTGKPNEYWPERLARPGARWFRLLKDRRIAAITGSMDSNAPEMKTRSAQLEADKINIRLDIIEGMGHTLPSSGQFADALVWVDALQQERIEQSAQSAQETLDAYLKRYGPDLTGDLRARKVLIQITIDAPWSEAAWEAARMLGIED